jgi:YebC/PmpR family DNA-binding regulatory protein
VAGHSHSANIARRKNAVDAKRGKIFSKLARLIISAARHGGGNPDQNVRLRYAVEKARAANMPKDNIERAIKRATGEKGSNEFEELVFEGYGPGGVAILVTALTDNRKRTAPDIKFIFDRQNGSLGTSGAVSFMFDLRSIFTIDAAGRNEEKLTELALEVGADDVRLDGDVATFYGQPEAFIAIKTALEQHGVEFLSAEHGYLPQNSVAVASKEDARSLLRLIDALEENDDVQNVYANYDIPPQWLEELAG